MRSNLLIVVSALALGASASLRAQTPPPRRPAAQLPTTPLPGGIAGTITSPDGVPLAAAAITVRSARDSSMVSGALTGKNGRFRIDGLPLGSYTIRVSLLGYKPRSSEALTLERDKPIYDFGVVRLDVAPVKLAGVEVAAERQAMIVEADRTVYNTKGLPAAAGNAADVLRSVPELEVGVDNIVKLRGNQGAAIYLNGRPAPVRGEQLANFLQQLPGNRIARVEVMPNPSAKYDSEGMGGIVNLVLRDDLNLGLSGSVSANTSTRNQQRLSGRANYQRGRLTLFTGAYGSLEKWDATNYDLRQNLVTQPLTSIEQNNSMDLSQSGVGGDWTAELKVGKQSHLWSQAWLNFFGNDNRTLTAYDILDQVSRPRETYDRDSDSRDVGGNIDIGVGFVQTLQPQKHELRIDLRVNRSERDSEIEMLKQMQLFDGRPADLPDELTLNGIEEISRSVSLQADYFRPLGKARLDLGYRSVLRGTEGDNDLSIYDTPDPSTTPRGRSSGDHQYDEGYHSVYTTLSRAFGKVSAQVGLRTELARTTFESIVQEDSWDNDYISVFPSLNLAYTRKPGHTARIAYSRRIFRPPTRFLNPAVPSVDPLNVTVGNPGLNPAYGDAFTADYTISGQHGTARIAPFFRRATGVAERIRTVDTLGVATNYWQNGASMTHVGGSITVARRPSARLTGSLNATAYREARDGTNISAQYRSSALIWSLGGNLGFKATEGLLLQLRASHVPTDLIAQGKATGYTLVSIGARQQLWGNRGSITLNVNDPFANYSYNSSVRDATFVQTSKSNLSQRYAWISFTYNFGKPPQQVSRRAEPEETSGDAIRVR